MASMLELKGLDSVQHMIRHASEDPLLPNPRNRQVGTVVLVLLCTVLLVVSFQWFDEQKEGHGSYHNNPYDYSITYVVFGYVAISAAINERMVTQLRFSRKLRLKNVIKFLFLSVLLFVASLYQTMHDNNILHWNSVTLRVSLLLICLVAHTASSSNHYNIVELVDQSVQRSSISIQNNVIDLRSRNKTNASELETVILNYASLLQVKFWLTIRFFLDVSCIFVLYVCLVHYTADAAYEKQYTVFMFGLFLIMQTTSMYTVGKFNKHIESLEFINNVNTRLMVRLLKWKPSEQVFMSSVVGMVILQADVVFKK